MSRSYQTAAGQQRRDAFKLSLANVLGVSVNDITLTVTAEDALTSRNYTVVIICNHCAEGHGGSPDDVTSADGVPSRHVDDICFGGQFDSPCMMMVVLLMVRRGRGCAVGAVVLKQALYPSKPTDPLRPF